MLYQTHHPLSFQFHPFPSSTPHLSTTSSLPSLPLAQAEKTEMECVEAALKTSFRKDMAMKFSSQTFLEELSAINVQNVTSCDDFFVDDLLDFSHEEALEEVEQEPEQQHSNDDSSHVSPRQDNQSQEICNPIFGSVPTTELSVPADDAAHLEWLSHFVEDSFSEYSVAFPAGTLPEKNPKSLAEKQPEPGSPISAQTCFKTPVPAKARSKRTRTGVRVWPLGSPSFTESSSSSITTTSSTSSSSSSSSSPLLIFTNTQNMEQVCSGPPVKKAKKRPVPDGEGSGATQASRRCSHCGVQKTPQWRTGPLGAKTLCNACGVRYKSGRLLPEYRPACSPTFSSELHSNHHRKVLEMRRKKEVTAVPETGLAAPTVVPSF